MPARRAGVTGGDVEIASILEKVQRVRREVMAAETERVDREYIWPEESLRALQHAGLGGLVIDRSLGGLGGGLHAMALVCESLGETCGSTAMCFGMHLVASAVIAAKATKEQKSKYLEPIARGEHLTTLALSEPGSGVHFYFPQAELRRAEDVGFVVTGQKSFVTNGGHADSYVVSTAVLDAHASPDQFSCLVVEKNAKGLTLGPPWMGVGMRGNASRSIELDRVHVPREALLGEEGDQMWYVFKVVGPYFLLAMAGAYLGVATASLRLAIEHLSQRSYSHNASSPARSPVVQHKLGSLHAEIERTRRLVYHAATIGDSGSPDALPAIFAAKAEVGDCVVHVTNEVMTLLGGMGYRQAGRPERLLRDARAAHVMAPTTDLLRIWTGRMLLRHPLLGD